MNDSEENILVVIGDTYDSGTRRVILDQYLVISNDIYINIGEHIKKIANTSAYPLHSMKKFYEEAFNNLKSHCYFSTDQQEKWLIMIPSKPENKILIDETTNLPTIIDSNANNLYAYIGYELDTQIGLYTNDYYAIYYIMFLIKCELEDAFSNPVYYRPRNKVIVRFDTKPNLTHSDYIYQNKDYILPYTTIVTAQKIIDNIVSSIGENTVIINDEDYKRNSSTLLKYCIENAQKHPLIIYQKYLEKNLYENLSINFEKLNLDA